MGILLASGPGFHVLNSFCYAGAEHWFYLIYVHLAEEACLEREEAAVTAEGETVDMVAAEMRMEKRCVGLGSYWMQEGLREGRLATVVWKNCAYWLGRKVW